MAFSQEASSSFLCLGFFWVFEDKLLVVVFKPCGQQPSRSFIQNVSRKPVVTLIGFMLISVVSETSEELWPQSQCVMSKRNI